MSTRAIVSVVLLFVASLLVFSSHAWASCSAPGNAIEAENCLTGTPQSTWDVSGTGDSSVQGFGDNISVNVGQTINFKVNTNATSFHLDIYRMGYYQGNGARKITTLTGTPQSQPNCLTNASVGLYDCGNWKVSASWAVPTTAVSGIYFARVIRDDTQGASHIMFIVRNDASHSDILFQATDTGWQAYNDQGGQNLYGCGGWDLTCRAYKVSYNRPFHTRDFQGESVTWVFGNEYPMIRWLEANGYDVSYFTDTDTDRNGGLILNHKLWMSNGHDEYWSGNQRANIEAARNAGVHLAFFSGNTMFWKIRWENSTDGSNTPYRTLVCYKETANDVTDPLDKSPTWTWTGTWRDPRFSPPADGGKPENAVKGNIFRMNGGQSTTMQVPAADGKMRFWRNTTVATASGTTNLAPGSVGAEFDDDEDNGFRPAGLFELTATSVTDSGNFLLDYGVTYGSGTAINKVVMYRHSSGAIVFSTGTYRWSWGLDSHHDDSSQGSTTNVPMQQATVNLFADMGIQPVSLQAGLTPATASTDTIPPNSTITSPASGASIPSGTKVTIQGTAADTGGGVIAGVEVSTDGGATWHPASGRTPWTYTWTASGNGSATLRSRAVDDSGNLENPSAGVTVTVGSGSQTCPCTIFGSATPSSPDAGADSPNEVGVRFKSDVAGQITGIRFYKSAGNTGTHTGNLWNSSGTNLATGTFTNETASGWQTLTFATPVSITAGTYYVASYFNTIGHYAEDDNFFTAAYDNAPLHAAQDGVPAADGVYIYSSTSAFPNQAWASANYWVDVVFTTAAPASGVSSVTVNPTSVAGGTSSAGTVTLTGPAPASGVAITLSSDNAAATPTPTGFTIPSGQTSGTFTVKTTSVTASTTAHITASDGKTNVQAALTITPVPALSSVTVNPTAVVGGNGSTGTVTLTYPAGAGLGISVNLSSDSSSAGVPASVTVPAGASTATFPITTTAVSSATAAHISGTYNSFTPPAATLTINPATATYSISGTIGGAGGNAATVTLSGAASATTTADASGNYSFPSVAAGAYTVTPSHSGFAFTPPSQNVTVTNANLTGVNFSTAVQTYTLQGTISGTGGSGATVTLSGTSSATVTADASGNYTFSGLANGPYTVTPSKTGFTFNPGSQGATVNSANVTGVNFSSFQNCPCSLWSSSTVPGTVSAADPNAVELGVRFTSDVAGFISGLRFYKGSTNTGTHVANLWSNTGTLLATSTFANETASGWQQVSFATPVAITAGTAYVASYHTTAGNYSLDENYFTSALNSPPLHGVQDGGSSGSNGVYVYGASAFPTTTFLSSNYYVDVVFTTAQGFTISGTISGPGGNAATVNLTGTSTATVTADASGNYSFTGLANGAYTVTPSKTGFTFTPASLPATVNNANVTALNFSTVTYSISGTISGTGGNGATVNLTGTATATATADASGNYTFTGLVNGPYTVTPSKSGFTFTPPNQAVTVSSANLTGVNFSSASSTTFSISGTISGPGGNAATVNLTGTSTATVTANASGNYSFTGLANGAYTVTPSKTGFTFTPASLPATVNNANVTALNFSTVTYSISGTISGTGGNGATVNLTGTATATATADASGNYTFTGLVNGPYTVTPSKSGFTFTPPNQAVTVSSANLTGVNFTSAAGAGLAIDKIATKDRSTSATTIVSPAFTTVAGNELLLAFVSADAPSSGTNTTVTGVTGGGLTWVLVRRTNTQLGTAEVWRAFAPAVLTNATVTATLSRSTAASMTVVTFTGVNTTGTSGSGAIGATASGSAASGAPTASLTTTHANSWVIGVGTDWDNATARTVPSNQTMVHQYLATIGDAYWVQRMTSTTPASGTVVTINDTAPTADRYDLTIVEVLPSN